MQVSGSAAPTRTPRTRAPLPSNERSQDAASAAVDSIICAVHAARPYAPRHPGFVHARPSRAAPATPKSSSTSTALARAALVSPLPSAVSAACRKLRCCPRLDRTARPLPPMRPPCWNTSSRAYDRRGLHPRIVPHRHPARHRPRRAPPRGAMRRPRLSCHAPRLR
ncbi:hypothetical protein B0H15DRAFT_436490 [Mycena belliarum]|uniref:Uncharacterized protein n=1 Tax=Mycena belliarum TaxID=1033014 RepID=A0AAD6XNR9_9AGAR|nr:hypothetical protein B0H15DRAFT_436490 [Mycena belliae]